MFKANGYAFYLTTVFVIMLSFGIVQRFTRSAVKAKDKEIFKIFTESSPVIYLYKKLKE